MNCQRKDFEDLCVDNSFVRGVNIGGVFMIIKRGRNDFTERGGGNTRRLYL